MPTRWDKPQAGKISGSPNTKAELPGAHGGPSFDPKTNRLYVKNRAGRRALASLMRKNPKGETP